MGEQRGRSSPVKNEAGSVNSKKTSPPGALSHIRVLDLSRVLAGPWAGQTLGDMGADVIKVEHPGTGDDTRLWGPPFLEQEDGKRGDAAYFTSANRNKRSVGIDFSSPRGVSLVRALAARSDVIIENYKLGGLAKYGLDYESLKKENPSLIYCSITGFGQDGPYAARPGYDYVIQGMSGLMSVTGHPDGAPGAGPLKAGIAVSDLFGGMYALSAILCALVHRERTGEGQYIDCSLLDSQVAALANQGASFLVSDVVPGRLGNSHPTVAPYRVYEVADGQVIIAVGNDGQFARLCDALGEENLKSDPEFATIEARVNNRSLLDKVLEKILKDWTRDGIIAKLVQAGVPCGPINEIDDVFADPHIVHREIVHTLERNDGTRISVTGYPVKMSATPATYRCAPPPLGADTDTVLREELGLSDAEVEDLKRAGVVGG